MSEQTKKLLIRIRGLLLLAVDLIDRECLLGKYANRNPVTISPSDSLAGVVEYQMEQK